MLPPFPADDVDMKRSQICLDCKKRPVRISLNTCRNGVRIRVDLCSGCWLERYRSGELTPPCDTSAETEELDLSCNSAKTTEHVKSTY